MAFKQVQDLDSETTISLGGVNKKTRKANPTSVEGYYIGKRKVDSKKAKSGFSFIYYFQTPKGNVGVWGKTDLDRKMEGVVAGNMVRASFEKMIPTPNGEMYKYKVEFDPDNTIEVTAPQSSDYGDVAESSDTPSTYDTTDDSAADEVDEDELQAQALARAERQAKVQAQVNKYKQKPA